MKNTTQFDMNGKGRDRESKRVENKKNKSIVYVMKLSVIHVEIIFFVVLYEHIVTGTWVSLDRVVTNPSAKPAVSHLFSPNFQGLQYNLSCKLESLMCLLYILNFTLIKSRPQIKQLAKRLSTAHLPDLSS